METLRRRPAAMPSGGLTSTPFPGQSHDERYSFAALCRIVRRPRPCGDGALWEIWAAGASPAGGSTPSGHSAAAVPAGDDGRGISVLCLFQPGPGGTGETTLNSPWGHWGPPFHNMGLCGRPGGDPNAWKHFGPEPDPGRRALHKAPGWRGILGEGLRGGGPGRPPFWRTLVSPVRDWTPVP